MTRCLVTGGFGFLGSEIVKECIRKGYEVDVVDNLSGGNPDLLKDLGIRFYKLGVESVEFVGRLSDNRYDYIFDFGSPSSDRLYSSDGHSLFMTVKGMLNCVELAQRTGASEIVIPSSGTVYGDLEPPQSETLCPRPLTQYASTKLLLEHLAGIYSSRELGILALRIFTGYGEGERYKGDIASFVWKTYVAAERGLEIEVYADGEQKRDFIYGEDIARVAVKGAESGLSGIINVGTGHSYSFNQLISLLETLTGKRIQKKYVPSPFLTVKETRAATSKLVSKLGFQPRLLPEGLQTMHRRVLKLKEKSVIR
jgi:UDP-glucose 4-epimerase